MNGWAIRRLGFKPDFQTAVLSGSLDSRFRGNDGGQGNDGGANMGFRAALPYIKEDAQTPSGSCVSYFRISDFAGMNDVGGMWAFALSFLIYTEVWKRHEPDCSHRRSQITRSEHHERENRKKV